MTDFTTHPARSAEFLSRLHDGDLSPAERAQFESHRAHCAPCRNAAAEFETALALYRSSRPRPAAPDLSARILRKLQASGPRRSPFGIRYGIDLRWAGAFLAALLAVIVGSAVVGRREAAERRVASPAEPIPVVMERERAAELAEKKPNAPVPSESASGPRARAAQRVTPKAATEPAEALETVSPESQAVRDSAQPPASSVSLEKKVRARREPALGASAARPAEGKAEAPPAVASRQTESPATSSFSQGRAGGEGGMPSDSGGDTAAVRTRLEVLALDGAGTPPALVGGTDVELPAELRGRIFILVVEAGGRVREVRPSQTQADRNKAAKRQEVEGGNARAADANAPRALKDLRFQPSDRPRILRLRVE